jgi:hypothetical protein
MSTQAGLERSSGQGTWEDRVEWALSGAVAASTAREEEAAARRTLEASAFDELCKHMVSSVLPILEACADKLRARGINAAAHQLLRNTDDVLPRALDVGLQTAKFDGRGPGALVITAVEGREILRVVTQIGPGHFGGDYDEDRRVIDAFDLTDEVVGDLVAGLVERLYS